MALKNNPAGWRELGMWVLAGALALVFLSAGGTKLYGLDMHVQNFARWGYPGWFMVVVGVGEVAGAALVLVPRLATVGGLGLAALMAGAVFTHLGNGEGIGAATPAAILVVLSLWLAYIRRESLIAFLADLGLDRSSR